MEEKKSFYAIIPANVRYDQKLTANAKLMYGEITALCNERGYCWATNLYFAELYGVSKQAISRWINSLKEQGYVSIEYERKGKEIVKRMVSINSVDVSTNSYDGINKKLIGCQQIVKENITSNNTSNNTYTFSKFWEAYPNKKAKGNAEKAWLKLKVDQTLLDIILTAIEQHKQSKEWTADGGRYIPHPASWLNARRWEDEISKQAEPTKSVDIERFKEWEQL